MLFGTKSGTKSETIFGAKYELDFRYFPLTFRELPLEFPLISVKCRYFREIPLLSVKFR